MFKVTGAPEDTEYMKVWLTLHRSLRVQTEGGERERDRHRERERERDGERENITERENTTDRERKREYDREREREVLNCTTGKKADSLRTGKMALKK